MSLSRLTLLIVGWIILLAIIGIWTGEPWQGVWRWPAVLLVVLVAWERFRLGQKFTVQRQLPTILALGESVYYRLTISNSSNRPLRLETQADYPASLAGDNALQRWQLRGKDNQSRSFALTPVRLGATDLGKLYIKQLGGLGLCWWTRCLDDVVACSVEPVRLQNTAQLAGVCQMGNRPNRHPQGSGFELLDLREYQYGDPLRSMDWKATAKRGKPIIRRFEREQRLEIVLLIDCGRGSRNQCGQLERLHHYVNIAAKLTEFAALQGDHIACLAYAQQPLGKVAMAGGIAAVRQTRQFLGQLQAVNETANALNAALAVKQLLKRRGLVVFLTDTGQPETAPQLIQAGQLLAAKHQVLVATLDDPALMAVLKQPVRRWQDPYRHFAVLEHQNARELTRQQLQRHGVAIISATAALLDRQVLTYYQNQRGKISGA